MRTLLLISTRCPADLFPGRTRVRCAHRMRNDSVWQTKNGGAIAIRSSSPFAPRAKKIASFSQTVLAGAEKENRIHVRARSSRSANPPQRPTHFFGYGI